MSATSLFLDSKWHIKRFACTETLSVTQEKGERHLPYCQQN